MEKRALIAVVISLVILVVYQELVVRRFFPQELERIGSEAAPTAPAGPNPPPVAPEHPAELGAARADAQPPAAAQHVSVDTDLYHAVFTSDGARLESFQLKKYRTTVDPQSPPQETVVPGQNGELPFGVELRGTKTLSDAGAAYTVEGKDLTLTSDQSGTLDFVWHMNGATIRKRFTFHGDRYQFSMDVGVQDAPPEYNEIGVAWIKAEDTPPQPGSEVVFDRAIRLEGRKLFEDNFTKLADGKIYPEKGSNTEVVWAGYAGRHFVASMIPIDVQHQRLWLKLRGQTVEEQLLFPRPAGGADVKLEVYIGPKDFDVLEKVGHDLSRAVNLGMFGFIAVPLLHVLQFSHTVTGNYGIDIIVLTVIIKVLFLPLTKRSFESMRAMQKLQPQMAKIREKFKDDSDQMNKEIMELYRRHKVNPLGGCLPMILQIPVFFGLYSALMNAVELRHAAFAFWIVDLAAPDRLGTLQLPFVQHPGIPVLTLLMGGSMFMQQWMTPTAGDPAQQRVMMFMPLMFTFMFVNFPAGLALYWLVNNVLTIAQQYYINRTATT